MNTQLNSQVDSQVDSQLNNQLNTPLNAKTLLKTLENNKIRLWADQGKLKISAAKGTLTPELKHAIAQQKANLLSLLAHPKPKTEITTTGLSLTTIGQLIGGKPTASPVVNPKTMATQLKVTFRPLPNQKTISSSVLTLRTELEETLKEQGVTIVPWQSATREFQYPLPIIGKLFPKKQLSLRVVRTDINAVIDVQRPINRLKSWLAEKNYQISQHFSRHFSAYFSQGASSSHTSIADITRQIAWAEDHAIQRLEDPTATQVILLTELDSAFTNPALPYTKKITIGINTLVSQFSEVVIGISESQLSILNMNLSDSLFSRADLESFVTRSLIPKIYVPIAPLALSRFKTSHYNPQQSDYAQQLATLSQSLANTSLLPSGFQLAEVVKRQSHRDIVSAIVNGRSGVSYGFVAYAEPPRYIGPKELSKTEWKTLMPVDGYAQEEVRQTNTGRQYLKTKINDQIHYKQIPDIWLVCSRSGANKTNLNINQDILRLGINSSGLHLQVADGIDLSNPQTGIKPSYDTYVMVAIALSTALYTPTLIQNGAPIIHFHGYPHHSWFTSTQDHTEDYAGTQNPAVPCGTYESGVFNFLSIHQLASSPKRSKQPLQLAGLVEPDHGINLIANSLEYLLSRVQSGTAENLITLGGQNLPSLKKAKKTTQRQVEQQIKQTIGQKTPLVTTGKDKS